MRLIDRRLGRRALLRGGATVGVGAVALVAVGCGDDDDDDGNGATPAATATTAAESTPTAETMEEKKLVHGWYRDEEVVYYDFGMNSATSGATVIPAPIWAFITGMNDDGTPAFVDGQHNVVDVVPGDTGYSDLWEVMLVTVPEDYEADSIKSREEVEASGYDIMPAGIFVNCPIVPEGTTFENGEQLVQGWNKGEAVFYPDFGANPPAAIPIWAFITGMDAQGNPEFVEGQNNVIDSIPGDAGYSAFWQVNLVTVDDGYEPNSIKSAADALASGFEITTTDLVVNCPVVTA